MADDNAPTKITPQRNLLHNHPLLRKGGVHRKSYKSKRRIDKVKMAKEWLPQNIFPVYILRNLFLIKLVVN